MDTRDKATLEAAARLIRRDIERTKREVHALEMQLAAARDELSRLVQTRRVLGERMGLGPKPYEGFTTAPRAILAYLDGRFPTDAASIAQGLLDGGFPTDSKRHVEVVRVALSRLRQQGKVTKEGILWSLAPADPSSS